MTTEGTPREIVLEIYRVWAEEGIEAAMRKMSPEIEWVEPAEVVGGESRRGTDDALEGYWSWSEAYDHYGGDIAAVEENGNRVLVHFVQRGQLRGGSVAVEEMNYQLWTVRDGVVARMQMFLALEDARAALYAS